MNTSPLQWDVLISYLSRDAGVVSPLARRLGRYRPTGPWWNGSLRPWKWSRPARLRVFLDEDQKAERFLWKGLEGALASSKTLLVACSPAARASDNVLR